MRRRALLALVLVAVLVPVAARAEAAGGTLVRGPWRGSVLGRAAGGGFLLLRGASGELRLEFTAAGPSGAARLLERRGEGWTVVAGARGGTRGAWGEAWEPLAPRWRALLAEAAAVVAAHGGTEFVHRGVVRDAGSRNGLRGQLVARGRGRGGPGETLVLRGRAGGLVAVTGSRRPGRLVLGPLVRRELAAVPAEAFTPMWPLADVLEEKIREPAGAGTVER